MPTSYSSFLLSVNACGMGCDLTLARLPHLKDTPIAKPIASQAFIVPEIVATYQDQALHGFSERFPDIIQKTLQNAGITLSDLGALAVAIGPGSFTGIRSSLAFLRAFSQACNIPLYSATSFDCWHSSLSLSQQGDHHKPCLVVLDTRRQNAYISCRTIDGKDIFPEDTATPEQLVDIISSSSFFQHKSDSLSVIGDVPSPYYQALTNIISDISCPDLTFSSSDGLSSYALALYLSQHPLQQAPLPHYIHPAEAKAPRLPGLQQLGLALSNHRDA